MLNLKLSAGDRRNDVNFVKRAIQNGVLKIAEVSYIYIFVYLNSKLIYGRQKKKVQFKL